MPHWSFLISLLCWLLLLTSPAYLCWRVPHLASPFLSLAWNPLGVISCKIVGTLNTIALDFQTCISNPPILKLRESKRIVRGDARNVRGPSGPCSWTSSFLCTPSLGGVIQSYRFILMKSSLSVFLSWIMHLGLRVKTHH